MMDHKRRITRAHQIGAKMFRQWARQQMEMDNFGNAIASGDFNQDGYTDVAVGSTGDAKVVLYKGTRNGGFGRWQTLEPHATQASSRFGATLMAGDFDRAVTGDELAVGAPLEKPGSEARGGAVFVLKGSTQGLVPWAGLTQSGLGTSETGDGFGATMTSGNYNGDDDDDLVVSAPRKAPGANPESGYVFVFAGSATRPQRLSGFGYGGEGGHFGGAVATRKRPDPWARDQLLVGTPGSTRLTNRAGAVIVYALTGSDRFQRGQTL